MSILGSYVAMMTLVLTPIVFGVGYVVSRWLRLTAALRRVARAHDLAPVEGPTEWYRGTVRGRVVEMGYRSVPLAFSIVEGAATEAMAGALVSAIGRQSLSDALGAARQVDEARITQFAVRVECANPRSVYAAVTPDGLIEQANLEFFPRPAVHRLFEGAKLSPGEALRIAATGGITFIREEKVRGQVSTEWLQGILDHCLALATDLEALGEPGQEDFSTRQSSLATSSSG